MVTTKHNPEKDIRQLANAILRYSTMPPEGDPYKGDLQYLAEHVVPLAQRMKNRYKSQWKRVGAPNPGLKERAHKKANTPK